jgi:hypothetical protein
MNLKLAALKQLHSCQYYAHSRIVLVCYSQLAKIAKLLERWRFKINKRVVE